MSVLFILAGFAALAAVALARLFCLARWRVGWAMYLANVAWEIFPKKIGIGRFPLEAAAAVLGLGLLQAGGAPWGVQLAVGGELLKIAGDDAEARGFVALLEIDFLRLTVMRQGSTDRYWENPSPAGGRRPTAKAGPLPGLLW